MELSVRNKARVAHVMEALEDFRRMSSITPTCDKVLEQVCDLIRGKMDRVINGGAGAGGMERMLIEKQKLTDSATVLAVEPSARLSSLIAETTNGDRRITVVSRMLQDVREGVSRYFGEGRKAQLLLTSAPISRFGKDQQQQFLEATHDLLEPDGQCIVYIFRDISKALRNVYAHVEVQEAKGQWLPPWPYKIHRAYKRRKMYRAYDAPARNGHSIHSLPSSEGDGWWRRG